MSHLPVKSEERWIRGSRPCADTLDCSSIHLELECEGAFMRCLEAEGRCRSRLRLDHDPNTPSLGSSNARDLLLDMASGSH
jgi:hypothetical protein